MDNQTSIYKYIFTDIADPRTRHWFLISSPIPVTLLVLVYLYVVKVFGPQYMKDKKPYKLKRVIRVYNIIQVAVNAWLFKEVANVWSDYNWNCQPIDYSPAGISIAWSCYLYFLNKIMDLLDTVFFVLRKKDRQISFLHVFHHAMMTFLTWTLTKYFPGGHGTLVVLLNSLIHTLLYSYYYLAAFGPKVQKYLWWKIYLTRIQLIQFCLVFFHSCQLLVLDCDYPKATLLFSLPNAMFFYYLFHDFYQKAYCTKIESRENKMVLHKRRLVKYFPSGRGMFVGLVNSCIHTILYTYYFLTAFGQEVKNYLFWRKKYLTRSGRSKM